SSSLYPRLRCTDSLPLFFLTRRPPTAIYTLSLHDALPIFDREGPVEVGGEGGVAGGDEVQRHVHPRVVHDRPNRTIVNNAGVYIDRKSTRLNSSHRTISYAVFCLKKKKKKHTIQPLRVT